MSKPYFIGVTGYSNSDFDEAQAHELLVAALDELAAAAPRETMVLVSGLTDMGVPAIAYREAVKRGWRTIGISAQRSQRYANFPVDEKIIVGSVWHEASETFIEKVDALIRIGGNNVAADETALAYAKGIPVMEFDLPAT